MFVENNMIYKIIFSKNNYGSKAKKPKKPTRQRKSSEEDPSFIDVGFDKDYML